jgi:hypothetical protein
MSPPAGAVAMALAIPFVGLGLVSCGGHPDSAKQTYEHRFQSVMKTLANRIRAVVPAGVPSPSASNQARVGEKIRQLSLRSADELAQIMPPAEVRGAHQLFVNGLRGEMQGRMRRAVAAATAGNTARAQALLQNPSAPRDLRPLLMMKKARDAFRAKGYHLAATGGFLP